MADTRWTHRQRQFQIWQALEEEERPLWLKTRERLAEEIGVNLDTLNTWEHLPGWNQAVGELSVTILTRSVGEIMRALVESAKAGKVTAIKLALEVMGVRIERSEQDLTLHGGTDEDDRLVIVVNNNQGDPPRKHGQ